MKQSLKNLMSQLPEGADGAIISSDLNRRYLTDMKSSAGTLVFTRDAACFIIDFRYIEKARSVIGDFQVLLQDKLYDQINAFFKEHNAKNIAIETSTTTVSEYHSYCEKLSDLNILDTAELSKTISKLRSVKTKDEIDNIKKAQSITDKTFSYMCGFIKAGMTEQEVCLELEYQLRKLGGTALAFESIVVSGVNSSMPHGVPTNKKIETGDFLTMDFGAQFDGYCSDMTRTVAIGKISDEQKKVYDTVLKSQLMAIEAISLDKNYSDIDKVARDFIYQSGYEGCFGHGLGHSLGLNIHEDPGFTSACTQKIEKDVIVTVEPGIYLEHKFGVRIEDMVLITDNGAEDLTKSDKNLITL